METHRILCLLLALAAIAPALARAQDANSQSSAAAPMPTPIVYKNTQYGFCFLLPADWKGYTIVNEKWRGTVFTSDGTGQGPDVYGPQLVIRNPKWTKDDPYQDIPIMIFTPDQWEMVQEVKMAVSAAPIGPAELGHNTKYVFALPPRWIGFYDVKGIDEVQTLMGQNPFQAPCENKSTQPVGNVP